MTYLGDPFSLALCGGGFRATLFHLGVVRALKENGALKTDLIRQVSAVSGGSILAAHLSLNWEAYTASDAAFDRATQEIIDFVRSDVRGTVIRKWVLGCATYFPRFAGEEQSRWSLGNLLQKQYSRLYNDAKMGSLEGTNRPKVKFHCTSLTTGSPCYFDQEGFTWESKQDNPDAEPVPLADLPIAFAVAASSDFPPLFPPIEVTNKTLSCDADQFPHTHRLTDGGVYDNLGIDIFIEDKKFRERLIIISDAEGNFDSDFPAKYAYPVTRNVRASDLLMKRVSALRLDDLSAISPAHVRIKIRTENNNRKNVRLSPEAQRALINVRTDLDTFSDLEIAALITHGFNTARQTLVDEKLIDASAPYASWDPLGNLNKLSDQTTSSKLQESRERAWRLWANNDPVSWATAIYAFIVIAILAAPTAFLAWRSATEAQKAAAAQRAAAVAQMNAIFADARYAEASALLTSGLGGASSA